MGGRVSGGAKGDAFDLQIIDDEGRGVCVRLTPEQWALALWSRADVEVQVEWIGMESDGS